MGSETTSAIAWKEVTLGEFTTLQRGHDLPKQDRRDGTVPILGSFGITGWHDTSKTKGPGVTVGRSGASFGVVSYSECDFWPLNTALFVKDFHGNDERFAYYFLKAMDFRRYNSGSAVQSLNRNHVHPIAIRIPPLPEQKAIAHILGTLDDKIELNRRMNETLESMARALFKSWFVDFDPVIDNALAAGNPIPEPLIERAQTRRDLGTKRKPLPKNIQKLFPNAFTFDERMGWIPDGWEVGPILNRADLLSGGTPKTSVEAYWNGQIKWASAKDVSQCGNAFLDQTDRMITAEGLNNSSTKMIPRFSTVIVSRGATTGRLTMFGDDIAMNQTCYALRSRGTDHYFLYCHARHFIDTLVNSAHGSVFDTITTRTFESTDVLLPPTKVSDDFNGIVKENFERILLTLRESNSLAKLRDTLLPKLLSGELRIPDAEKLVAGSL